eukprot:4294973-Amphidinium_carterae.3
MQSVVSGVATAACLGQSSATAVRGMALRVYGAHSHWSAIDQRVRCHQCAPPSHPGPLVRIRGNSPVDLSSPSSSSSDSDGSGSEEEQRIEEEIRSQDFIGMIGEDFHLVDAEMRSSSSSSDADEISQPPIQGRDEPENTGVYVRAHQRTLYDSKVIHVRSHIRSKGKGKTIAVSPVRVLQRQVKRKRKRKQSRKTCHGISQCSQIILGRVTGSEEHFGSRDSRTFWIKGQSDLEQSAQVMPTQVWAHWRRESGRSVQSM